MTLLGDLAHASGIATVSTIHQPSVAVYSGIDDLLLLSRGRTAYFGPADALEQYLDSVKKPLPKGVSIAEHALDLFNADFTSTEEVELLLDAWTPKPSVPPVDSALPTLPRRASIGEQLRALGQRHGILLFKDPTHYLLQAVGLTADLSYQGIFFWNVNRNLDQQSAFLRTLLGMNNYGQPTVYAALVCLLTAVEKPRINRELFNAMYNPFSYIAAVGVMNLFMMFMLGAYSCLLAYAWGSYNWVGYPTAWAVAGITQYFWNNLAQLLGWRYGIVMGPALMAGMWGLFFATSGVFFALDDTIWPFRLIVYINPFYWGFSTYIREQTLGSKNFSGAVACDVARDSECLPQGIKCDDVSAAFCLGRNGQEVLESLHEQFKPINNDNEVAQDLSIIAVFAVLIKVIHLLLIYHEQSGRVPLQRPDTYTPLPRKAAGAAAEAKTATGEEESLHELMYGKGQVPVAVSLMVSDVSVQLKAARGESEGKYLLKNVSARADSGKLVGVMGPSGAGKSTLLNMLMGVPIDGATEYGSVTLNGEPLAHALTQTHVAFVEQHDTLWTYLTCREHMSLATTLYQGAMNVVEQQTVCTGLIAATGLVSCAETRAGDDDHQGLSGGQRRRLSLAMAFAKKPSVLIADEPTTGLDSAAAVAIIKLMGALVRSTDTANITTIHQPSAAVYSGIDDLLLLSRGRTAYFGPADALEQYLDSVKKPLPEGLGVAEHALDLFNADFVPEEEVELLLNAWFQAPLPPIPQAMALMPQPQRAAVSTQISQLLRKHTLLNLRDPVLANGRILSTWCVLVLLYILTLDVRYREQHDVLYIFFLVVLTFFMPGMMSLQQVLTNAMQWAKVKREIHAGLYGPFAYWFVFSVFSVIVVFLIALTLLIPIYAFADYPAKSIGQVFLLLFALFSTFDAVAELFCYDGREMGAVNMLGLMTFYALGSGAFVGGDDIIWPFRIFYHISPAHWYLTGMHNAIFKNIEDFSGAVVDSSSSSGFKCNEDQIVCHGATGEQILRSLHAIYPAIDASVHFGVAVGWIFLTTAVLKIMAFARIYAETAPKKLNRIAPTPGAAATETSKLLSSP